MHRALWVGEMPALKQVEEEVPNRWVGLLELVYEDDAGFAGLDFQGELALFAADVAARASDERVEGVFAAVVAEVDLREGLARGEQIAEDAGRLGLADAGRAEQEHGQYRLLADGVEQPEDSDLLAKLLFERSLADEVAVEVVKELVGLLAAQVYEELCSAFGPHCFLGGLSFDFGFLDFVEQRAHVVFMTRCRVLIGHEQRVVGKLVH